MQTRTPDRAGEPADALVGRELELASIEAFLTRVAAGSSCGLLIEGDAGMGKTALWQRAVASSDERGFVGIVARPVETEAEWAFTTLVDLLQPVGRETLARLPQPQRHALEIALLLRAADAEPDRRALGTAVLNALRVLSETSPLLVAVDDVQWADSSTHAVLAFAARRLRSERVGFVLTRRADGSSPPLPVEAALGDRLERLAPSPLGLGSLNRLLQMRFGHPFSRPLVRRLRDVSGGNPFFTIELARALDQHGATPRAIGELPLPRTLREVVHDRLLTLPAAERRLLVGVAALSHPTLELLGAAFGKKISASSLRKSFADEVVVLEGRRLRFTHPLLASVVYSDADPSSRRTLHGRLATLIDDPEESAQHRALAADGDDAGVASSLDTAAAAVRARGGSARAAELLTRAAELTPPGDPLMRVRRLAAADCWTDAGDAARAVPLLESVIAGSALGAERADALARLGWIRSRNAGSREGSALFERADREAIDDPAVRISVAKGLSWTAEMLGDLEGAETHARDAVALAEPLGEAAIVAESVADLAFIQFLRGRPGFASTLERALMLDASHARHGAIGRPRWLAVRTHWFHAVVMAWTDRLDEARDALLDLRAEADELGHEHILPNVLNWLGRVESFADGWRAALAYADEAESAAGQADLSVDEPYILATIGLAHAHLGEVEAAATALTRGLATAKRLEVLPGRLELLTARGFLELSLGKPQDAHATLNRVFAEADAAGITQPATLRFHPLLVEAAIDVGDLDGARRCQLRLESAAQSLRSPWTLATSARCQGLVAAGAGDLEAALARLEDALLEHRQLPSEFERARTQLHHGIVLRRLKKKRAARESLLAARETFDRLGARLWAERARAEQARISGSGPKRAAGLSETESRVAALVAAGRANKQVAAELHVTVRTVESNLTSIYRKLGIRSRGQLAATLHRAK